MCIMLARNGNSVSRFEGLGVSRAPSVVALRLLAVRLSRGTSFERAFSAIILRSTR